MRIISSSREHIFSFKISPFKMWFPLGWVNDMDTNILNSQADYCKNHAFNDASMKLDMYFCQGISFNKKTLATQKFKMATIFQDGRRFQK